MKQRVNKKYSELESKEKTIDKIIADFMGGNSRLIGIYYHKWRAAFMGFLFKKCYRLEESELESIYNDSFNALYQNIRANKFEKRNATVFSYLCSIGRKKLCTLIKTEKKYENFSSTMLLSIELEADNTEHDIENKEIANKLIKVMGEPCKTILMDFYINQVEIQDIAQKLEYTEGSLKNKKGSCLQKAKDALKVQFGITKENWK